MFQKLLSLLGIGPKEVNLPEAKTHDPVTLYFGRFTPTSQWRWEWSRLPEVLASIKRVGNRVVELRVREDLSQDDLWFEIRKSLSDYEVPLPPTTWVDRV